MKDFVTGLFSLISSIVMWIPIHWVRIFYMRIFLKKLGKHVAICRNVEIRSPWRVEIGNNTSINKDSILDGRGGGLIIGNNVDIAQECNIWSLQHDYNSPDYQTEGKTTIIEDYAWIASRATILPGVKIGYGSVVATCSVVTKDVPPLSIVAGCPARVIAQRENNMRYHLGKRYWFQ